MIDKNEQTIYERAEIGEKAIFRLREKLGGEGLEVLGHLESLATCCRNGTVALVKINLDEVIQ